MKRHKKTRYGYQVFGTTTYGSFSGKHRNSKTGFIKTKKTALKKVSEYKKIPVARTGRLKNLRVKKVRMKIWNTYQYK